MTMMTVITTDAHADVVYEPLIVASGFNRDVIAECYPMNSSCVISYLQDYADAGYFRRPKRCTSSRTPCIGKVKSK